MAHPTCPRSTTLVHPRQGHSRDNHGSLARSARFELMLAADLSGFRLSRAGWMRPSRWLRRATTGHRSETQWRGCFDRQSSCHDERASLSVLAYFGALTFQRRRQSSTSLETIVPNTWKRDHLKNIIAAADAFLLQSRHDDWVVVGLLFAGDFFPLQSSKCSFGCLLLF